MPSSHRNQLSKLPYADFYARMLAHNIDLVILLPFFYLIGWFTENNYLLVLYCGILYLVYHVFFEYSNWAGTPGKRSQKMRVTNYEGHLLKWHQVLLRNVTKFISILLLFVGIIMIALDAKRRGLHDKIARTVVIFYLK
jgi:uncharacterized RDD family membrane protein YckC